MILEGIWDTGCMDHVRCPIVPSRQDLEKERRRDLRFDIVGDRSKEGGRVSQEGNSIDKEFVA